jgi:hypothetical protein
VGSEAALAERFGADERAPVAPPSTAWPERGDDVGSWLHDSGLDVVAAPRRIRIAAAEGVQAAVAELAEWVEAALVPLLAADVAGGPVAEVTAFRLAASTDSHHAHSAAHQRARPLLAALVSAPHREWVDRLRAASDATVEWRAALSQTAHTFAGVLREHGAAAAEAGLWKKAEETLDGLQVAIRQRRQNAVTAQVHAALVRMLPDADIALTRIQHAGGAKQQRGVRVGLTIGGREARLGMLSSGQRNALLLTPLVILDGSAPFGFLVVDDPVHALDDIRVDLLAAELTHDPRLEEHLRSRWLEDARGIAEDGRSDGWGYGEPAHRGRVRDRWAAAYGVARRAATVYGETSTVLHSNRAFGDLPEHVVREWEQVVAEVGYAVAAASRPAPK